MSRLDEELNAALSRADEAAVAVSVPAPGGTGGTPPAAPAAARRGSLGLLVGLLVAGGAVLALVFTSLKEEAVYSKGVDELLAQRERLADRTVRVEGILVKGSLAKRESPCEYRFVLQKNGATLPVSYAQCVVPDTFRDVPGMDVQVTAEGKLGPEGRLDATHILAKCPSKYEMQDRAAKGESAPHAPLAATEPTRPQAGSAPPGDARLPSSP